MPKWMHDRADRIQAKNPDMPKGEAFAIATQQMHALGKSPKGYGTAEGRATAKGKYKTPKDDQKTAEANVLYEAFFDELANIKAAGLLGDIGAGVKKMFTTPIPGTPELSGLTHAAEKLKGLAAATKGQGPSKGFEKFQQMRTAAGH